MAGIQDKTLSLIKRACEHGWQLNHAQVSKAYMVCHFELFYLEVYFCCYKRAGNKKLGIFVALRNCNPLSIIDLSEQLEVLPLACGLLIYTERCVL